MGMCANTGKAEEAMTTGYIMRWSVTAEYHQRVIYRVGTPVVLCSYFAKIRIACVDCGLASQYCSFSWQHAYA